jgi:nucleotide-binding universal stress UspA family protein
MMAILAAAHVVPARLDVRLLTLRKILVATDLTETSDAALVTGGRLAGAAGAALHVVHVTSERDAPSASTGLRTEYTHEIGKGMRRAGVDGLPWHTHIVGGDAPREIATVADTVSADVIVLGRRGEGRLPTTRPVGGTAYAVITGSEIPCMAVKHALAVPASRMLVTIDHSTTAHGAVLVALSWASGLQPTSQRAPTPTLTVLHVAVRSTTANQSSVARSVDDELDLVRRVAGDWAGVDVRAVTVAGDDPAAAIAAYAREHDMQLVVLGTRGLSAEESDELGSVSAAVTSKLDVPVLLVPPAVWHEYAADLDHLRAGTTR